MPLKPREDALGTMYNESDYGNALNHCSYFFLNSDFMSNVSAPEEHSIYFLGQPRFSNSTFSFLYLFRSRFVTTSRLIESYYCFLRFHVRLQFTLLHKVVTDTVKLNLQPYLPIHEIQYSQSI